MAKVVLIDESGNLLMEIPSADAEVLKFEVFVYNGIAFVKESEGRYCARRTVVIHDTGPGDFVQARYPSQLN